MRVLLTWTRPPEDYISEYSIVVVSSPAGTGCGGGDGESDGVISIVENAVPGSEQSFSTHELEEFTHVSLVVMARNEEGESTAHVNITTPSAGKRG